MAKLAIATSVRSFSIHACSDQSTRSSGSNSRSCSQSARAGSDSAFVFLLTHTILDESVAREPQGRPPPTQDVWTTSPGAITIRHSVCFT